MPLPTAYLWNKAPFVRLLIALVAGILLQWELQLSFSTFASLFFVCFLAIVIYFFLSLKAKYKFNAVNGVFICLLIAFGGGLVIWGKDVRHNNKWIGHYYKDSSYVVSTIQEPLAEKANSYKALAAANYIYINNVWQPIEGQIIIYFKKDPLIANLHYGSQIIFKKNLQEIKNAGNPGSFDYKQYSLFQGITHQVYLKGNDFIQLPGEHKNAFEQFIFTCRRWVVATLQEFIKGEKEQGLAEALLIGYKDDLDKNLIQSYTNTGVVHIIAISGMHLALIYGLLVLLTKPLQRKTQFNLVRIVLILSGLWLFSILAGAQASVIRSAVMFSCIALGELLSRKTSIYNTMALSAFVLLCYNPFWLWDVGFQLSYAAVLSIIIFFRPIYNWFYFSNKIIDNIWKLSSVSIAAQILTTPVSLYHFHQFPVLFLLTNLVAVPLSSLVLFGEIGICALFFIKPVAVFTGLVTERMIWFMNSYIERIEKISFALWDGFSISILQTVFLTIAAAGMGFWLMEKKKKILWLNIVSFCLLISLRSIDFWETYHQKKIIVYNVPRHLAIDLVSGRNYNFIGDSALLYDEFTRNFHIQPSRILHRISQKQILPATARDIQFNGKRLLIIDSTIHLPGPTTKQKIDFLILSKNPKLYISDLSGFFSIHQIIIDGSVPAWKARLWKKDCDSLQIPFHDVSEKGAFVMNL